MTVLSKDAPAEISGHPSHPKHKLTLVVATGNAKQFRCDGCKEVGAGERYRCEPCDFDLHKGCAIARDTLAKLTVHPLFKKYKFKLRYKAPSANEDARVCDACGSRVIGFYYHCANKGLDLHLSCAKLPMEIKREEVKFELRKEAFHRCSSCRGSGGVGSFWFYRSTCKTVYLHVRCVKELAQAHLNRAGGGRSSTTSSDDDRLMMPFVKETALKEYRGERSGGTFERICKIVATVVRIIIAVIIGDPTPIIAAVVVSLFFQLHRIAACL